MSNETANSDNENTETKKRGPKGPRPIVWVCAGVDDHGDIISDTYSSGDIEVDTDGMTADEAKTALAAARDSFTEESAMEIFAEDHGVDATMVHGPFFERKGEQEKRVSRKRDTIRIPVSELRFSGEQRKAIYNGWIGWANLLSDRDDVVYFLASEEVDPDSDNKKKVTPSPKNVLVSAIEFVEDNA